jgi:unsaturated chondroitin disaccharide hydrolase
MMSLSEFSLRNCLILCAVELCGIGLIHGQMAEPMASAISFADRQMRATLAGMGYADAGVNPDWLSNPPAFPTVTDGASGDFAWETRSRTDNWAAAFTPGLMWDLYELTGDPYWKEKADAFTDGIDGLQAAGGDMRMNMGFHMMNSYARRIALDVTHPNSDADIIATGANNLLSSWMPAVGSQWSFSWGRSENFGGLQGGWSANQNTIMDSAPNMEVLFYEAKQAGDADMWDKAVSHLNNLARDNIREDGSTAQLASYDPITGELLRLCGHQGYSSGSTWSRGQGWALHGFAIAWRETRDPAVGETFRKLYQYYRDNCPDDGIPYWDFDAPKLTDAELEFRYPGQNAPALRYERDTSAAALAASALMQAAELAETPALRKEYFLYGRRILESLSTPGYLASDAQGNPLKGSILAQGTRTFPETGKGLIWGDFYFVEALRRYRSLVEPESGFGAGLWGDLENYATLDAHRWKVVSDRGSPSLRLQGRGAVASLMPSDIAIYRSATLGDFSFTFLFRADELPVPGNSLDVVFVFDYTDGDNFTFVRLSTDAALSAVVRVDNGLPTEVASLGRAWDSQVYADVTITRTGDTLDIEVIADSWATVRDPAIAQSGFIGIGGMGHNLLFSGVGLNGIESPAELSPRAAWRVAQFSHPLSILGWDEMDPDHDGRDNLMEYALGTSPLSPAGLGKGLQLSAPVPGSVELTFPYSDAYSDICYNLMRSLDGGKTWIAVETIQPGGTGSWTTAIHGEGLVGGGAALYRLEVIPIH